MIAALLDGPQRFGELQQEVGGIAPNVLTQRLRALERDALVVARPYSERPPRFVYELSAAGRELSGALRLLAGWGARNVPGEAAPRHASAGPRWRRAGGVRPAARRSTKTRPKSFTSPELASAAPALKNAAMLRVLGLVISIGLADSLNPTTIAPALYLATGDKARAPGHRVHDLGVRRLLARRCADRDRAGPALALAGAARPAHRRHAVETAVGVGPMIAGGAAVAQPGAAVARGLPA